MSQYMNLIGSEDVSKAGHNMQSAAQDMQRAAGSFTSDVDRMERILREFGDRSEETFKNQEPRLFTHIPSGLFYHSFDPGDGKIQYQGRVESEPHDGWYLVTRCSWITGFPNGQVLVSINGMSGWHFYSDEEVWREEGQRLSQI